MRDWIMSWRGLVVLLLVWFVAAVSVTVQTGDPCAMFMFEDAGKVPFFCVQREMRRKP